MFLFMCVWGTTVSFFSRFEGDGAYVGYVYLIFSFFWTLQVIKAVVRVTAAGTFATWFFLKPDMPQHTVSRSFKRAITKSLGSICVGSLLTAIVQVLRALASSRRGGELIRCFLGLIEGLIRYFNRYAFTQVAIYGKSYFQAARSTWELFCHHGLDVIINDDLTGGALSISCFLGGAVTALAGGIVGLIVVPDSWVVVASLGFFIGLSIMLLTTEIADSGVATMFVCLAEEPQRMAEVAPAVHNKLRELYSGQSSLFTPV